MLLCLANNPTAVRTSTQTTYLYEDALSSDDGDNDGERWSATNRSIRRSSQRSDAGAPIDSPGIHGGLSQPSMRRRATAAAVLNGCAVANVMLNDMLAR